MYQCRHAVLVLMPRLFWRLLPLQPWLVCTAAAGHDTTHERRRPLWYEGLPGVRVLEPGEASQDIVDEIFSRQKDGQFNSHRYAIILPSGNYRDLHINVGYYTSIIGVGSSASKVRLDAVESRNGANGHATNNFWRSFEGVTLSNPHITWAVSQASPGRRSTLDGDLSLSDHGGYSSGGFLADVLLKGTLRPGSQQQWFFRNMEIQRGLVCVAGWNYMFMGVTGLSSKQLWACGGKMPGKVSVLASTPRVAEKPYLVREDDNVTWQIYVPEYNDIYVHGAASTNKGLSSDDLARKLDLADEVFVARPSHSAAEINARMLGKRGLLLTPGIYYLDAPIVIKAHGTVVLGIGYATLVATDGKPAIEVEDDLQDVRIAGVLLEAGTRAHDHSGPTLPLLLWGRKCRSAACFIAGETSSFNFPKHQRGGHNASGVVSDVFVRVGSFGYQDCQVMRADTLVTINSDDVVLDNVWVWHADHDDCGTSLSGDYGKSDECHSIHGIVVNGHRTTAYGLAVEHIVKGDHLLWNGEDGETYFYQCELPYHHKEFSAHGYAVANSVKKHSVVGIGVYIIGNGLWVKTGILLPPSASASHVYNYVIGGVISQFKHLACYYQEWGSSSTSCHGADTCTGGRCFRNTLPQKEPLDIQLPKAKTSTTSTTEAPQTSTTIQQTTTKRRTRHPPHSHNRSSTKVEAPNSTTQNRSRDSRSLPIVAADQKILRLEATTSTTQRQSQEVDAFHIRRFANDSPSPEETNEAESCIILSAAILHPACAMQPSVGISFICIAIGVAAVAGKFCTTRKVDGFSRMALIPSQSETRGACFINVPSSPTDDISPVDTTIPMNSLPDTTVVVELTDSSNATYSAQEEWNVDDMELPENGWITM